MADFNESATQQVIANDPQIQAILQQARQDPLLRGGISGNRTGYQQAMAKYEPQIYARLNQLGVQLPQGYGVSLQDGSLGHDNWFERNAPWLVPAALGGAAAITSLTAPAAAAAGGAGSGGSGAAGTDAIGLGPTGLPLANVPPSLADPVSAGAGAASDWGSTAALGPTAAGGGTTAATVPSALSNAGIPTGGILGALGKYGGVLGDLGGVLTNASAADANARRQDAANQARGIAENNAAKTEAAKYNLALPSVRANQVSRGEILNTMQNAPLTGDPRIDKFSGGGLRPSAFGPQARQAGALEASTALNGLQNPSQDRLTPQEIPPYQPSTLDNFGAGAGLGLDIFSLLSKYGGGMNNGAR